MYVDSKAKLTFVDWAKKNFEFGPMDTERTPNVWTHRRVDQNSDVDVVDIPPTVSSKVRHFMFSKV